MNPYRLIPLALAGLSLALASCGKDEWVTTFRVPDSTLSILPAASAYPDHGAVILFEEGSMEVVSGAELAFSTFETHRIIRVFDERGERFANVIVPYSAGSTVDEIRARTVGPDGKITVLDEKEIFDVSLYHSFIFFSDQRAKIFTMPGVEPGAVVEYQYRVTIRSRTYWHAWAFQHEIPTLRSRFTLVSPSEWDVVHRTYGIQVNPAISRPPGGFKATYRWEATDIEPVAEEFAMPPLSQLAGRLALAPIGFRSWEDVARWYDGLSAPAMKGGGTLAALAREVVAGAADDREKLQKLYCWVRDRVRYLAVEIGIGGFQPHPAEQVLGNRYGDCKDMTTLLCTMAEEVGITARQALISTWQNGAADTGFATPLQFNHVIAYAPTVGQEGIWMDATEKGCPFGRLPWYDQGMPVLLVGENGESRILVTPREPLTSNGEHYRWEVVLRSDGSAQVDGATILTGAPATEVREALLYETAGMRRRWLETALAKECAGAELDSFSLAGLVSAADSLTLSYRFHTRSFALPRASGMSLRPGTIGSSELADYFRSPRRRHPVRFRFGMWGSLDLHLRLPENWVSQEGEGEDSLVTPFGAHRSSWSLTPEGAAFQRSYRLAGETVPAERYLQLREFLDNVRLRDAREFMLVRR